MTSNEPQSTQKKSYKDAQKRRVPASIISLVKLAALIAVVYFGNVEVQSFLGRQALAEVTLPKHSFEHAMAQAKAEGKPVLLDLSAIWCPSCRKLDQQILSQPAIVDAIKASYVFVRVEVESPTGEALKQRYGVRGLPTLLILDADGNRLKQLPLTFDAKRFIQLL